MPLTREDICQGYGLPASLVLGEGPSPVPRVSLPEGAGEPPLFVFQVDEGLTTSEIVGHLIEAFGLMNAAVAHAEMGLREFEGAMDEALPDWPDQNGELITEDSMRWWPSTVTREVPRWLA